ncbi:MAG: hypothetical protein RID42_16060 [Alphaproteobacteria bacterium]
MIGRIRTARVAAVLTIGLIFWVAETRPGVAGPLENLERERASMIRTWFDPGLDAEARAEALTLSQRRLLTLEQLVLRDDSLIGRNTPTVRRAFANFDLTFLTHAGIEQRQAAIDTWLAQVGLTTETLMAARIGRR